MRILKEKMFKTALIAGTFAAAIQAILVEADTHVDSIVEANAMIEAKN